MASRMKDALADAGVNADALAPEQPLTLADLARAQKGSGARTFTLAPGCEWKVTTGVGKSGITVRNAKDLMLTFVPEGGRIQEVPLWAVEDQLDFLGLSAE